MKSLQIVEINDYYFDTFSICIKLLNKWLPKNF